MASYRPSSAAKKHGGGMYGGRSSYVKSKGLDANSDEDNLHDSLSDEELFANFNATSVGKGLKYTKDNSRKSSDKYGSDVASSPFSERQGHKNESLLQHDNPMMMTMKKPMHPSSRRSTSPPAYRQSSKLGRLGENVGQSEDESSDEELSYMSSKQSSLMNQRRPKSPNIRGRQRGSAMGELSDERPKPLPRQKRLQDDDDAKRPVPASRTSPFSLDRRTPTTLTNLDQQRTLVDRRKSPADERDVFGSRHETDEHNLGFRYGQSRRSPLDRQDFIDRTSPHLDTVRKSPLDRREFDEDTESFERYGVSSRKSPSERRSSTDRKSPLGERRPSSVSSRKSPFESSKFSKSNRQTPPADDRKTLTSDRHKSPVNYQRRKDGSPIMQRKGSVVDFLTESSDVRENERSDEERMKYRTGRESASPHPRRRMSTSPSLKRSDSIERSPNPFENIRKSPSAVSQESKQNSSADGVHTKHTRRSSQMQRKPSIEKENDSDGDSSVCEELIEEPTKQDVTSKELTTNEDRSKKTYRADKKKSEETIEIVKGAQAEWSKMRYIDPANAETPAATAKRPSSGSGRLSTTVFYKPKPRYAKPEVGSSPLSTTATFESTDQIRDAAFREWLAKRDSQFKRRVSQQTMKDKETEEQKAKEKQERIESGKKAYEVWKKDKDSVISERDLKKRKEEEKAKMEEAKKKQKKEEATLTFTKWKSEIDQKLKEDKRKIVMKERMAEETKKQQENEKKKDAVSAYQQWKRNKDEQIFSQVTEKRREIKMSKEEELSEQKKREKEAARAYERWLNRKERCDSRQSTHVEEERRPWRPSTLST